jgi:hypothetical protein
MPHWSGALTGTGSDSCFGRDGNNIAEEEEEEEVGR